MTPTSRTAKTELLLRQTRIHFPRLEEAKVKITPIEKGGSDRKFYRVRCSPEQTIILVKYNLEREENRHYVEIAEFLAKHKIRAPKIYFHDPEEGLIWIEDLGKADLWSYRDGKLAGPPRLLRVGARRNRESCIACRNRRCAKSMKVFPTVSTRRSIAGSRVIFSRIASAAIFGIEEEQLAELARCPRCSEIADKLAQRPRVLVHRDFQSQNIIIRNGQAHLIDFQGMRPGLAEYDLASLLFDPYVTFSRAECEELLGDYESKREAAGQPVASDAREIFRLCGIQRLMQALGVYGFLGLVKGNKAFLDHVPAAMTSLRSLVGEIPGLEKLSVLLDRLE